MLKKKKISLKLNLRTKNGMHVTKIKSPRSSEGPFCLVPCFGSLPLSTLFP